MMDVVNNHPAITLFGAGVGFWIAALLLGISPSRGCAVFSFLLGCASLFVAAASLLPLVR